MTALSHCVTRHSQPVSNWELRKRKPRFNYFQHQLFRRIQVWVRYPRMPSWVQLGTFGAGICCRRFDKVQNASYIGAQYPPATFTSPPRWAPKQITTSADTTSSLQCPTLTFLVSGIYDHDGAFPPIYISPLWWQLRKQRIRSKFPLQPVRTPLTSAKIQWPTHKPRG